MNRPPMEIGPFLVDKIPPLHQKLVPTSKKVVASYASKGLKVRIGPFSLEEDKIIRKNMDNFLNEFPDKSVDWLLGFGQASRNFERRTFVSVTQFLARLAHGLPDRLLDVVRRRARKVCHKSATPGCRYNFSAVEIEQLASWASLLGNDHVAISHHIDRTPSSIERKLWRIKQAKGCKTSNVEISETLKTVIYEQLNSDQSVWNADLFWPDIAQKMPPNQKESCEAKWATFIKKHLTNTALRLFDRIVELDPVRPQEITWVTLAPEFDLPNAYSAQNLFETGLDHFLAASVKKYDHSSFKKNIRRMRRFYRDTENSIYNLCDVLFAQEGK